MLRTKKGHPHVNNENKQLIGIDYKNYKAV